MNWHALSCDKVIEKLGTDIKNGISESEVKVRLLKYGKNIVCSEKSSGFFKKLLHQLSDFMVIILILAAVISFITSFLSHQSDYIDTVIILGIVIINSVIGVLQESKAEKELAALKNLSTPLTKVIRGGKVKRVSCENIVPGDILTLSSGDLVCADSRIVESYNLMVEESAITGESFAIEKNESEILEKETLVSDRKNMLFTNSIINRGYAKAVVVSTGMNTEVGKVAKIVNSEKQSKTPLQNKLAITGKIIAVCIMAISLIVFVLGVMQHIDFMEMFMISISLAVAAIPEGLPAVVTIVLANGVRLMAKRNAIVRNLPAVETLGHANVICSDKTGTLTLNKMAVKEIRSAEKIEDIKNNFSKKLLCVATLCSNSELSKEHGNFSAHGEPTENALVIEAAKNGITKKNLLKEYLKIHEFPFDSSRKMMSVIYKRTNKSYKIVTKGAPEVILKKCSHYYTENGVYPINEEIIGNIEKNNAKMASEALRVLAVAYKEEALSNIDTEKWNEQKDNIEKNLVFLGLIGIIDPPRPEAKIAVYDCKRAGIKPVMITGDNVQTAKAIAKEVGIISEKAYRENKGIITGGELNNIEDKDLRDVVNDYSVFARVSPEHKVKIVKAFQSNGNVVAMTGDGINDAPALKIADIGCAMGKMGTDAAKSASDIIIADDNFATIVEAVKQGRGMFENIKKTVHFLISTNIGEVMVVLFGFLLRVPPPLLAIHLLWINLVTDAFPALALGMDPIDKNIMSFPPKDSKKSLFAGGMGYNIVIEGLFIAAMGLLSYSIGRAFFDVDPMCPIIGQTMAFLTLGLSQLIHAFNVQSRKSLFITGFLKNLKLIWSVIFCIVLEVITVTVPALSSFFKTRSLNVLQWAVVWILALLPLGISELEKIFQRNDKI